MNKRDYHRLLNMRYSQELMFKNICYIYTQVGKTPRDAIKEIGINHKRAWYLLDKWSTKGIYEYGVNLELGWFVGEKV